MRGDAIKSVYLDRKERHINPIITKRGAFPVLPCWSINQMLVVIHLAASTNVRVATLFN